MACAIIRARVYFPAPVGPVTMTPWGNRSRPSAARMRRTTSSFPWKEEKDMVYKDMVENDMGYHDVADPDLAFLETRNPTADYLPGAVLA
jgi:hypothetical protein